MIPSSINALQTESPASDQLGVSRAPKKKNVRSFAALFSSLLDKARPAKDGAAPADSIESGTRKTVDAAKLNGAADSRNVLRAAGRPEDSPRERSAERGSPARARVAESPDSAVPAAPSGPRLPGSAAPDALSRQPAAFRQEPSKESAVQESAAGQKLSRNRSGEPVRKGAARDGTEGGLESQAAALNAGSALALPRNAIKKDEAEKGDARIEGAESRRKDRRKERLEIEIFDRRTGEGFGGPQNPALKPVSDAAAADSSSKSGAELVLTLREGAGDASSEKADSGRNAPKTSFADALARELRETYNGDIVKRASVVLKDGGDGLVRLTLRPEALGSVKIKLELADNKVAGRILVETEEALKAFGKELRSLEQAFVDGGFDGASLELALSSGDSGAGSGRREGSDTPRPFFSDRLIASEYDSAVPAAQRPLGFRADALIDMLA